MRKRKIVQNQSVHFGEPVVKGTRVTVSAIVGAIASGDTLEQVAEDYGISKEDVLEAVNFALERLRGIYHALQYIPLYQVMKRFGEKQTQKVLRLSMGRERETGKLLEVLREEGLEAAMSKFDDTIFREVLKVAADVCEDSKLIGADEIRPQKFRTGKT
ncbi:MAG: DUF433 domain-containing protein [Armatimonadetes bacterium]|nr:DUF433 domain-containing protein [Armatimonadota bacterium]MDW8029818.1 DUF433 domain-containing protein [Armatimonadota bacterium]